MTILDLFKKSPLNFIREESAAIPIFSGFDPNNAFAGQRASGLAQSEIWAHGGTKSSAAGWFLLNKDKSSDLATSVVSRIIDQEKVNSVLIDACNKGQSIIRAPKNTTVIHGIGYGV